MYLAALRFYRLVVVYHRISLIELILGRLREDKQVDVLES